MDLYIGTKIIQAEPMAFGDFMKQKMQDMAKTIPDDAPGYKVIYPDNYKSWSPEQAFNLAYHRLNCMTFSEALDFAKIGRKIARSGWNGKNMFIFLVDGSHFTVNRAPLNTIYDNGTEIDYRPHLDMKTVNGEIVPWVASQTDLLSNDWYIVE